MVATGILLASFLTLAWGKPMPRNLVLHERRDSAPEGFVHSGAADSTTSLTLRIALQSNDMSGLEVALYEISDPTSNRYGQHLSKEEVEAFVAPSPHATSAVHQWLADHGLTATRSNAAGDWLSISVNVATASELLDAEFSVYTHQSTGYQAIRTLAYSIPPHVREHVQFLHPTIHFSEPRTMAHPIFESPIMPKKNLISRDVPASCAESITPACLQSLYGIPATPATHASNSLGVTGFLNGFAQKADLKTFLEEHRPDMDPNATFALKVLDGGSNPQGASEAGSEANLDIQYTVGVATGVPVTFISVGQNNTDGADGLLDIVNDLLASSSPPHVLTTSYGFNEKDFSVPLAINICNAYMQLGARGVSILFSSGDGGVAGIQREQDCSTFTTTFPSCCPWVTSVGGTRGTAPEVSFEDSAGGFSNIFPRPLYQKRAVESYLTQLGSTNAGLFNLSGRAYPDVAAQGSSAAIFTGGKGMNVAGTSVSTPIFASVIALLNDERMAQGKSPLGFLNTALYSAAASAFNDITSGNNPGCGTDGFSAMSGWDPVTGLGTPNYPALRKAFGL